jgi:hypothetical protein
VYIGKFLQEHPLNMRFFNGAASKETATEVLATIEEPRRRKIMQNYIDHAYYESVGNLEMLMPLCSHKCQQYLKIGGPDLIQDMPQSYSQLAEFYENMVRSNTYILHREIDKLIVGEDAVFTDGIIHTLYPGGHLQDVMNLPEVERDRVYQLTKRVPVVFLFDEEGLSVGEHIYMTPSQPQLTEVAHEWVPEKFWNNPITGAFSCK